MSTSEVTRQGQRGIRPGREARPGRSALRSRAQAARRATMRFTGRSLRTNYTVLPARTRTKFVGLNSARALAFELGENTVEVPGWRKAVEKRGRNELARI